MEVDLTGRESASAAGVGTGRTWRGWAPSPSPSPSLPPSPSPTPTKDSPPPGLGTRVTASHRLPFSSTRNSRPHGSSRRSQGRPPAAWARVSGERSGLDRPGSALAACARWTSAWNLTLRTPALSGSPGSACRERERDGYSGRDGHRCSGRELSSTPVAAGVRPVLGLRPCRHDTGTRPGGATAEGEAGTERDSRGCRLGLGTNEDVFPAGGGMGTGFEGYIGAHHCGQAEELGAERLVGSGAWPLACHCHVPFHEFRPRLPTEQAPAAFLSLRLLIITWGRSHVLVAVRMPGSCTMRSVRAPGFESHMPRCASLDVAQGLGSWASDTLICFLC